MANAYIRQFLEANALREGDVLLVQNLGFGLQSQFVPFLGYDTYGNALLAAETDYGVRFLNRWEQQQFFEVLNPTHIKWCQGNDSERQEIARVARENLNEDTFNLVVNWTEIENSRSPEKQDTAGSGLGWGAAIAALGLGILIWGLTKDDD